MAVEQARFPRPPTGKARCLLPYRRCPASPTFASFVPDLPRRVLVLAHGYPWPDNSRTDGELLAHASARVEAWKDFAGSHGVILVAPVFGGTAFPGYREMAGADRAS